MDEKILGWFASSKTAVPHLFGTRDQFCGRRFFHRPREMVRGWFGDDWSTFHLLCTLFLSFLCQLHLRPSGIRTQRFCCSRTLAYFQGCTEYLNGLQATSMKSYPCFKAQFKVHYVHGFAHCTSCPSYPRCLPLAVSLCLTQINGNSFI